MSERVQQYKDLIDKLDDDSLNDAQQDELYLAIDAMWLTMTDEEKAELKSLRETNETNDS